MAEPIRPAIWGESIHEQRTRWLAIYSKGMHNCIANGLREGRHFEGRPVTLQEREHGLTKSVLAETDVLQFQAQLSR